MSTIRRATLVKAVPCLAELNHRSAEPDLTLEAFTVQCIVETVVVKEERCQLMHRIEGHLGYYVHDVAVS